MRLSARNHERFDRFKLGHTGQQQAMQEFNEDVVKKHQLKTFQSSSTRQAHHRVSQQRKEENLLRHFEANANKYKEDVKFDNFKKHVVTKLSRQTMQVREKEISSQMLKNLRQKNTAYVLK